MTQRPAAVAAVTVNFGVPDDTFECVRSLQASGYPDLRIVVVDNGSPGETRRRLAEELPVGVTLIESPENLGFAGGNNLGIRHALASGADYVLLINNDATLQPDALRLLTQSAPTTGDLGILSGKILVASDAGPTSEIWSAGGWYSPLRASGYLTGGGETDRGQYQEPGQSEFLPACMWFVPASVFRKMGLMQEDFFLYAEDLDYCLRLRQAGYRLQYDPRVVCYHKVSQSHWHDRNRASPLLNYYTNRNRILIARKWLPIFTRALFYLYFTTSRLLSALLHADRTYLTGIWDGLRGKTGPLTPAPAATTPR